jgi:DNA adenine methylase
MISYIGGKARIGKWIVPNIPTDIETYVEGFSGMFWVFFNMDLKKFYKLKTVVYNDYNGLNANLMKWTKQYDVLWDALSQYPCQQVGVVKTPPEYVEMFNKYQKEVFNDNLVITDDNSLEIACKYVYVLTQVFSGSKPESSSYTDYKGKYRCKVLIFMDKLKNPKYREHIDKITFVESMDFQDVVEKYDSPTTYFYMDPPYWKTENYYSNHLFTNKTHERLATCLKNIKGKFSLSYYDFPLLSEWFPKDQFKWKKKKFKKAASSKKDGTQNVGTELLIMNYKPPLVPRKKKKTLVIKVSVDELINMAKETITEINKNIE